MGAGEREQRRKGCGGMDKGRKATLRPLPRGGSGGGRGTGEVGGGEAATSWRRRRRCGDRPVTSGGLRVCACARVRVRRGAGDER